jgi:putative nucleotidyltransferase with HDIG domain
METCEQTKGMNILQHGRMVNDYYNDLFYHLSDGVILNYEWKLPLWIYDNKEFILKRLLSKDIIDEYQIYHDIGKPFCRSVDSDGKVHFKDHAIVSAKVWRDMECDESVARLIEMDMDIHTIKDKDVQPFSSNVEAITLLITGLCEVHANASMFGGIGSTSFKIKWKQIDRRGRAILTKLQGEM